MEYMLSPSLACTGFDTLASVLKTLKKEKADYLHVDVMDGEFVPNFCFGTHFVKRLRELTDIPLDIHLMIRDPERKLGMFGLREGDLVSVHFESTPHVHRVLSMIRDFGAKPMVAYNPATPTESLRYLYDIAEGVLVMTVNPGFAGQPLVASCIDKIRDVRKYLDIVGKYDAVVAADGNVSFRNIPLMRDAGCNLFIGGTSSFFSKDGTLTENFRKVRELLAPPKRGRE